MSDGLKVLVIAAHHDDIEFGCAGSIALWTASGAEVVYCLVTDGSAGSNDPTVTREALIARREAEQLAAAREVGVAEVIFLGYRDSALVADLALRRDLTRVIRQIRPNRVLCQDPTTVFFGDFYINHPDHRAAGEGAIYAVFPSAETRPAFPELLAEGLEPFHVDELYLFMSQQPNLTIDISSTLDQKLAALLCHESQLGPEATEWIKQNDAEAGEAHGYAFAESFRVMNFRREPPTPPAQEEG